MGGTCTRNLRGPASVAIAVALTAGASAQDAAQSSAAPQTITMAQLDGAPRQFLGRQVQVQAAVQDVIGPRLFTVDEQEWFDFDGDTLVLIHAPFAGLISEDERVTITGTVRRFVLAEIQREWGAFDLDPRIEVDFKERPILVAKSVKSEEGVELAVPVAEAPSVPHATTNRAGATGTTAGTTRTTASTASTPLTSVSDLARTTDRRLIGRPVNLANARVVAQAWQGAVWVSPPEGQGRLLVVPSSADMTTPDVGQIVRIQGVVLEASQSIYARARQEKQGDGDEAIYVFASVIRPVEG